MASTKKKHQQNFTWDWGETGIPTKENKIEESLTP